MKRPSGGKNYGSVDSVECRQHIEDIRNMRSQLDLTDFSVGVPLGYKVYPPL